MSAINKPIGHEHLNLLSDDQVVVAVRYGIPIFVGKRNDKGGLSFKCPVCKRGHHHGPDAGLKAANCFVKPPVFTSGYFVVAPLTDDGVVAVESIKRSKLESFLKAHKDQVFSIDYVKKDETARTLTGRLDVAPLKGGKNKVEAFDRSYLTAFDVEAHGFRTVNLDTATRVRVNGKAYDIVG